GAAPPAGRRGPVLLGPFIAAQDRLAQVAVPNLSRAAVYDHLAGLGVTPADTGDEDEALAGFLFVTPSAGLLFVNESDPVGRQRFSAAHELGHFVLHRDEMGGRATFADTPEAVELTDDESDRHEREANRFAAELLMPADACRAREAEFRKAYRVCPRTALAHYLAAEFLVSRQAMDYRLEKLGLGT
ncbi:MAG: ImmA/IrrE family metallo-endopeptidase, partial [Gemmataceae bacterium]|nr:ImmA/IrrE family metallo-endopeptidase [Gemmataceae bacterium]